MGCCESRDDNNKLNIFPGQTQKDSVNFFATGQEFAELAEHNVFIKEATSPDKK